MPENTSKSSSSIVIILGLVAIMALGFVGYTMVNNQPKLVSASPQPSPLASTLAATPSPTPSNPSVKTFISPDLGISFSYRWQYSDGSTVDAKEIGDKVYVYASNTKPLDGQYIQVFKKDPIDTLDEAIAKSILTGYSKTSCIIKDEPDNPSGSKLTRPANYTFARMTVPEEGTGDLPTMSAAAEKCPHPYTAIGGLAFFLADSDHPDKFAFISIGQYGLNGDTDKNGWQDTIKFTN